MQRKIIHCDCDCFFAAVEMRDNPQLRQVPLAVGGDPGRRGVISTCNYPARNYGIRSAMPSAQALKLCPNLTIIPGSMEKYRQASAQVHEVFQQYTDLIEPLSLDEAYLDVSKATACRGSATLIAEQIRQQVVESVGITISAGVAPNKFLAKIASDWNKPDGLFVVLPEQVESFVEQLPVSRLHGVGPATLEKLQKHGIENCSDLRSFGELELVKLLGRFGQRLFQLSNGIDDRPVVTGRRRKSLSVEQTYSNDLPTLQSCYQQLPALLVKLEERLRRLDESYAVIGAVVKVKFDDFVQTTVEHQTLTVDEPIYRKLLQQGFERASRPVRLLGVGVRLKDLQFDQDFRQLNLFESN
ncbi:MAG: DNA polymerase IV [Motiliproteus sp.]|nr:DNA polymerase IV [Motiliproteus sp.]MCW9051894.1 DNA polymerase IV [Motiliproteus sp.]